MTETLPLYFGLASLRAFGMVVLLPLGSGVMGWQRKALLSILFASGAVLEYQTPASTVLGPTVFLTELLSGLVISLPCVLLVQAGSMLGDLVDTGRGQSIGSLYDPSLEQETSRWGALLHSYLWALLLLGGVGTALCLGYADSLNTLPLGTGSIREFPIATKLILQGVLTGLEELGLVYLLFGLLFLLIDSAVGIVSKLVPGVQLFSEAFQLKTLAALVVTALVLEQQFVSEAIGGVVRLTSAWVG